MDPTVDAFSGAKSSNMDASHFLSCYGHNNYRPSRSSAKNEYLVNNLRKQGTYQVPGIQQLHYVYTRLTVTKRLQWPPSGNSSKYDFVPHLSFGVLAVTASPTERDTQGSSQTPTNVTLTALVGKDGKSALECWALTPPLAVSNSSGTIGALGYPHLGATGNSSYTLFSQYLNAGLHQAPAQQLKNYIFGDGPNGELVGNYTLRAGTILLALDTKDVSVLGTQVSPPEHVVLHDGGCRGYHM
ncbi:hypothetical protein DL96DRAFT_1549728 [Flagelloscypha sp. PMI_526]|nr:hypothetical protein DL96DRAFT_1549728 [Flagelloscypha sp. PMI_526]